MSANCKKLDHDEIFFSSLARARPDIRLIALPEGDKVRKGP